MLVILGYGFTGGRRNSIKVEIKNYARNEH